VLWGCEDVCAEEVCHFVRCAKFEKLEHGLFVVQLFRVVSAWACALVIALEMKSLQNVGFPTGDPRTQIPSVISRGTPLMVEFGLINERSFLPKDAS
jgi:hypothetical protein